MRMKLALASISIIGMVLFCSQVQAQNAFEKGRVYGTLGLLLQSDATPVTAMVEYGASDEFGVAGKVVYHARDGYSAYSIGVIGNYHLARAFSVKGDKFDPYVGLHIGKPFASGRGSTESGEVFVAGQLGLRYLVNERIGPYAQLNLGFVNSAGSSFELGAAFKFGK